MFADVGVLLETLGVTAYMQPLWAVTIVLASSQVVAETYGLSLTI